MSRNRIIILVLALLAVSAGVYYWATKSTTCPTVIADCKNGKAACYANSKKDRCIPSDLCEQCDNIETNSNIEGNKDDLINFSIKSGDTVSGILNFTGTLKGG